MSYLDGTETTAQRDLFEELAKVARTKVIEEYGDNEDTESILSETLAHIAEYALANEYWGFGQGLSDHAIEQRKIDEDYVSHEFYYNERTKVGKYALVEVGQYKKLGKFETFETFENYLWKVGYTDIVFGEGIPLE